VGHGPLDVSGDPHRRRLRWTPSNRRALAQLGNEQLGLLKRGEVTAFRMRGREL
jgi:hypothetical protein